MPPSSIKYRHLGRSSAHRQSLLRNLVTSLIDHESIATTWPKAKEAQRMAEKLITLGKRNTNAAKNKAQGYLFNPHLYMDKIFGTLRERYATRPGGYTRVLRIEPKKDDQAPSAILELVDGPKDMRFAITARTVLKLREEEGRMNEITSYNVHKVTRFRTDGEDALEKEIRRLERLKLRNEKDEESEEADEGQEEEDVIPKPNKLKRRADVAEEERSNELGEADEELALRFEVPPSMRPKKRNQSAAVFVPREKKDRGPYLSRLERRKLAREAGEVSS